MKKLLLIVGVCLLQAIASAQFASVVDTNPAAELAQSRNAKTKIRQQWILEAQQAWSNNLTNSQYLLDSLFGKLRDAHAISGAALTISSNYENCIPATVNPIGGQVKIGEISLATNLDFSITITPAVGGMDMRALKVSCIDGSFVQVQGTLDNSTYINLTIPDANVGRVVKLPLADHLKAKETIEHYLKLLIASQVDSVTNK